MNKINRKKLLNPLFATDSYKHSHHGFVPQGTTLLYSHLTPRGNKRFLNNYPNHDGKVVVFGIPKFTTNGILFSLLTLSPNPAKEP